MKMARLPYVRASCLWFKILAKTESDRCQKYLHWLSDILSVQVSDVKDIRRIIDLGCAAGLSTAELHRVFPEASITGIDLSPYFLSVGKVLQQKVQFASASPNVSAYNLGHMMAEKWCPEPDDMQIPSFSHCSITASAALPVFWWCKNWVQ